MQRLRQETAQKSWPDAESATVIMTSDFQDWSRSPRVNGTLVLKDNPLTKSVGRVVAWQPSSSFGFSRLPRGPVSLSEAITDSDAIWARLNNEAYSRFRGRLYKGNAALGVTLGSYKQSREMIVRRYGQLNNRADYLTSLLSKRKTRAKDVASAHLEVIFGWTPLLADIHAAATTVIQLADVRTRISSTAKTHEVRSRTTGTGDSQRKHSTTATFSVTWGATVKVTNHNRWLAERAGLLNPLAVAWDLVPWSFVVNMFVNTGSLVNSVTDFAGLAFTSQSVTRSRKGPVRTEVMDRDNVVHGLMVTLDRTKIRTTGMPLRPTLQFRVPNADWGTAAMAASLFTQKIRVLQRLIPF